jgi:hypothetical protein
MIIAISNAVPMSREQTFDLLHTKNFAGFQSTEPKKVDRNNTEPEPKQSPRQVV